MSVAVRSKVTIRDVAEASGVAPSTVSGAGRQAPCKAGDQGPVLRRPAASAIAPPRRARLRLQQTWSVGLVLADVSNPFFPDIVRGIEDVLWSHEYNLIVCNTDYRKDKEAAYLQHLLDKQLDGLILASTASDSDEVERLQSQGIPFVMLNRRHQSVRTDYVGMDNEGGVRAAVAHLHRLGHRRIAFIKGRAESSAAQERFEAFRTVMREFRLPVEPALVAAGDYSIDSGRAAAAQFLALPELPTAIVSANDFMAIGAMGVLAEQASRCQVASRHRFRQYLRLGAAEVNLTTVQPHSRRLGASAASCSSGSPVAAAPPPREIILPTDLISVEPQRRRAGLTKQRAN
jgi:LacI family transcriptional regulator